MRANLVLEFEHHFPFWAVIFSLTTSFRAFQVGSEAHTTWLKDAVEAADVSVTVLGGVPRVPELVLPERHLGLHMPGRDLLLSLTLFCGEFEMLIDKKDVCKTAPGAAYARQISAPLIRYLLLRI